MKWIGQHIYDLVSRFRDDVYLEDISTGTIASGGNLGLDSNNKIVKQDDTGITDLHGAGVNGANTQLLTDDGDGTVTSESTLTYNSSFGTFVVVNSTNALLTLATSHSTATPVFTFQRMATGADGQDIGKIKWTADDEGDDDLVYANIFSEIADATPDEEAGNMSLQVASYDGVLTNGLQLLGDTNADGEVDVTIASGAASTTTVAGDLTVTSDLTVNGDNILFQSANADDPIVTIKNTSNAVNDMASLNFVKDKDGGTAAPNDNLAEIYFSGEDASGNTQEYGRILAEIDVATHGQESGILKFGVANHDGGNGYGLTMTGGSVNDEVDITVGLGAASVTTVAGTLTMGSTATLNNTGQIQVASQPSITTLAGLTSLGAAGATTDIAAGDLTMYNAVNDGVPTISIGSSATERLEITANYASGTQQLNQAIFTTYTASGTSNRGRFIFSVDETTALQIWDAGLNLSENMALQINGTAIISDSSGTATLSNIDALDATTEATIEAAMDTLPNVTSLGTLTNLDVDNININGDTITASGDMALVATGNDVTVDTDTFTIESAAAHCPILEIKSIEDGADGGHFKFHKDRGAQPANDDIIGTISWNGDNDAEEHITYGQIEVSALEVDDTDEAGRMRLVVAESNGTAATMTTGLLIEGSDNTTDGEVNVTIAAGAASVTTVAGKFTCASRTLAVQQGTDGNHDGDVVYFGGTTSMTIGKIYHYKSDGTWEIANADAVATSDGLLGVALGAASNTNGMLLRGIVVLDHDPGAIGDVLYVQSDNAGVPGNATATAPSASGDCVRIIGYQVSHASNGNIWFNPDNTFVEVA